MCGRTMCARFFECFFTCSVPCQSLHPAASTPHTHPLHLVPYCRAGPLRKLPSSVRPASEPARFGQARFIIDPIQADPLRDRPGSGRPALPSLLTCRSASPLNRAASPPPCHRLFMPRSAFAAPPLARRHAGPCDSDSDKVKR